MKYPLLSNAFIVMQEAGEDVSAVSTFFDKIKSFLNGGLTIIGVLFIIGIVALTLTLIKKAKKK